MSRLRQEFLRLSHRKTEHAPWIFIPVSVFSVGMFVCVYVVMFHLSIPEGEPGHGGTVRETFQTLGFLSYSVALIGIASVGIAFPIMFLCLNEMSLLRGLLVVWSCVLAEIVMVTPLDRFVGWLLSYVVFVVALAGYKKWGRPLCTELPYG